MKLIDSSGWLQFFTDGPLATHYASQLALTDDIVGSPIVVFEVYKVMKRERSSNDALIAAEQVARTRLVPLTADLAIAAADIALEHGLPLADAIIYATALDEGADLYTSDADFRGLPGVIYEPVS